MNLWQRLLAVTVLVVLASLDASVSHAQGGAGYRVTGVPVDATRVDAIAARRAAIDQGEREALRRLLNRMGSTTALGQIDIDDYVASIDIENERVSSDRYQATVNVSFVPEQIDALLAEGGVAVAAPAPSGPAVIVPVLVGDGRPDLWGEDNPWRQAWSKATATGDSSGLVVPLGDLDDSAAVSATAALDGDGMALSALADRYRVGDAIVAVAVITGSRDNPQSLRVYAIRDSAPGIRFVDEVVTVPAGVAATAYDAAAARVIVASRQSARAPGIARGGPTEKLTVAVPLADLSGWVHIRQELEQLPQVQSITMNSFARREAQLTLNYTGELASLESALRLIGAQVVAGE